MFIFNIVVLYSIILAALALPRTEIKVPSVDAGCTITEFSQVSSVTASCTNIVVRSLNVPAGQTLNLKLKTGTTLTFEGTTKFGHTQWPGPLIMVSGEKLTVQGASGSVLDGQGQLYWDGKGGKGTTKPKFFSIRAHESSTFKNIKLLNCPINCVSLSSSTGVIVSGWNIDCSAGHSQGHNTDGFDLSSATNIVVENSVVKNQDDCVAVNKGSNMLFKNLECHGGHGLSLSVGMSKTNPADNQVSNITFSDCKVVNSANGIHVKTHSDGTTGLIQDVTYQNIELSGITNFGASIQEDYGGTRGQPVGNIPIKNLKLINVHGTMTGTKPMSVYILCGENGCKNWTWSKVSITGSKRKSSCNFKPNGYSC